MLIRSATGDDLPRIVDLVWQVAGEGRWIGAEIPFDRDEMHGRYARILDAAESTILVADSADEGGPLVVGHTIVGIAPYGVADVSMLVDRGWRGRGVGQRLMDAAIEWAEAAGAHKMWLEVWPHNSSAIALYERSGFRVEGRKRRHYRRRNGELWDALLMGRQLQPAGEDGDGDGDGDGNGDGT